MTEYVVTITFPTICYMVEADDEDGAIAATDALLIADIEGGACTYNVYPEA